MYLIYGITYTNFYHNSVNNTSSGEAFHFNRHQSLGNRVVNNIFKGNTSYAVEYQNSATVNSILESDYNNLFTSGSFMGRNGSTTYGTLNEWQTATGFETNTISIDPQYQSNTVLYTAVSALSNIGKNVNAIVPDDIDGIARSSTPSLGANQFGSSGIPLTGDYTINASGSGPDNFTTITAALDALKNFGISGPVTFKLTGDFNEQLTFLAVSGSSSTNTVTFESATGLPGDAIIRYSSTNSGSNFTIRLNNADHHRLKNLTIKAEGTTYGRVIHAINRTINLELDGNVIESVVTTNTSSDRSGIVIASAQSQNVRIINNTIRFGAVGIDFQGPTSKATGTLVQNNLIFQSYHRGILLDYHTAFVLDKNQVSNNPSSGSFQGLTIANVNGPYQITANKVTGGNATALDMYAALATLGSPALIANNFLQSNNGSGYATVNLNYIQHADFYHNNINATGSGTGLYYVSASGQNIRLINNNIKSNGYTLNVINASAIGQIDYNNYFTSGTTLARWNSVDQPDIGALQVVTGQDANSLSVDPQYQSEGDLTTLASSLAGAGLDLTSSVPADINGSVRAIPVSIGATQYSAAFTNDGALSRIISPANSCSLTNATDVRVEITNLGAASISGFQVAFQIDSGTPVVETIPGAVTIVPAGKYEYTFTQKADLSAKQAYTVKAYIIFAGDENTTNDQLETTVTHFPDLVTTLTGDATICKSTSITLAATGGTQYLWDTGDTSASITVSPIVTTTYMVTITNANGCAETKSVIVTVKDIPLINYTNDLGYTSSFVSPTQGGSDLPFDFRMIYTDANGNLPASGYPRVELDANNNGQATDPLDIIRVMQEVDATDVDVTDGKEYRVSITNLSDQISWKSRIVASNTDGCSSQTPFVSQPFVSNDLLDVAIYANDISFSKSNPAINESIKIYARIRNTSDFLAENFVVSAYIENVQVFSETVVQLNPQSSITLQWDQNFVASGFYPVKVVIDETNVLSEDNELNNFAIRPVLVGDYQLPGGINPVATAFPLSLQPNSIISITGKAEYFGIEPGIDPDVAGATVIVRIAGGSTGQATTQADGTYQLGVRVPAVPGNYTLNVEVTDYTLTGYQGPIPFTVLPAPPLPDLSTIITLSKSTILQGEQITGTAIIQNVGEIAATNFVFRYLNCDAILGEHVIAQLNPGELLTYQFTTTTNVIGDCFNRNNCLFRSEADLNNQVTEKTKINNQSLAYLTVLPDKPDLTVNNPTNQSISGNVNMLNPFTFYVRVDNIGGIDANTPFDVNVYMDATLIHTESLTTLPTCSNQTFTVTHNFADVLDHVIYVRVDEPIGTGNVDEYRETNNEFSKIIKHLPPPVQYPNLNVNNGDISITPVLPSVGNNFNIDVVYRNTGSVPIVSPFDLELTVIENGIPRIETQTVNSGMAAGATATATITTNLQSDGDHSFRIRLDNGNSIAESSEGDNVAQMPLCVDFSVSPTGGIWSGGFYVNTVQNLTATIYNYGLFTATNVPVTFYLDNVAIGSTILSTVGPSTKVGGYSVSIPFLFDQAGTFELKVVVDESNAYTECREDNNEYKKDILVRVPAPDLRVLSEYIAPSKINPDVNEQITIFLSYDNIGVGNTGPFKARILVDDVPLGPDISIPSVPAGEDGTVQITTPYSSSTAGIRVIRALLDPDSEITETTKTNNEASRALVVGKAPNLLFTDLQPSIACPSDGENVIITATLFNSGDLDATADMHLFYITELDTIPIDVKRFTLEGKKTISIQTDWLVINKNYQLYGEIRGSDPEEFDLTDNSILTKFCGGPYYNLLVSTEGQGIVKKTPNLNRYEGIQQVEITAVPATGWDFMGWQGDATGISNPLDLNLDGDYSISALFSRTVANPTLQNGERCGEGVVTLTAMGATGTDTYAWYDQATGGNSIYESVSPEFITPSLSTTTSYYVSIKSASNESQRVEVVATINPIPEQPIITVIGDMPFCPEKEESVTLTTASGFAGYLWSNSETTDQIVVTSAGTYNVKITNAEGCESEVSLPVDIIIESCSELIVYNGLSANDDELNSYLQIKNIDAFPDTRSNQLKIYNRWGDLVFEIRNYDNVNSRFIGLSKNGDRLPSGTYFYILKFDSGRPGLSGYLELKR
ncbi:MAG: CARDB domain-containing protein [Cyclobacteriaceae bacterium]